MAPIGSKKIRAIAVLCQRVRLQIVAIAQNPEVRIQESVVKNQSVTIIHADFRVHIFEDMMLTDEKWPILRRIDAEF
jgi:hypothetical protein